MFIASQPTPPKCSQLTYHTSYLSKPCLQKVHSFPNHPLKKFIAYLPYFIAYLTCFIAYLTWIISYQNIQKWNENTVKIIHSLLTIDHSFPNHHPKMFIVFQTIPPKCSQLTYHTLQMFISYLTSYSISYLPSNFHSFSNPSIKKPRFPWKELKKNLPECLGPVHGCPGYPDGIS